MRIINDFERKTPSKINKEYVEMKCGNCVPVYTISSINDLNQFIGYGKYINCKSYNVYLRGQTSLYDGAMIPSLYRHECSKDLTTSKFYERINKILQDNKSFVKFPKPIFEATVQHYGIKTPQIDIVDNVWIALWFALNEFKGKIINTTEHLYVSKTTQKYGYIFLIASDALEHSDTIRGLYKGSQTQLIDLRKALPSYYLRPHAQHAYMLRKNEFAPEDYSELIIGIAKIPVCEAQRWIGDTELLSVKSLFPSAYFDSGYEIMLKNYPTYDSSIVRYQGSIQIISD